MSNIYNINGNVIDIGSGSASAIDYDRICKAIAHRGYSNVAPENTIPAYKLAKQAGFNYVECDICWTSDNVPVLSHDLTIDRCSNGSGTISNMTLAALKTYDFGSWKSSTYAGTTIPTFEEFIALCRKLGLHPYLDLRNMTNERYQTLYDIYSAYGMVGNVTWITDASKLAIVAEVDPYARLGLLIAATITSSHIESMTALKTDYNEVFIDDDHSYITDETVELCRAANIPLEIWTVGTNQINAMNPYVTGCTSNEQIAGKILYDANIE